MINVYAPLNTLGYGVHAINWLDALDHQDVDFGFRPLGGIQLGKSVYHTAVKDVIMPHEITDFDAPTIVLWHHHDLARYRGTPLIGYTVFETSELIPKHVYELSQLDAIWVPSQWAKEVLLQYSELDPNKIFVVPEGVNPVIYNNTPPPDTGFAPYFKELIGERYAILSAGKFEMRKGNEIILDLMCKKLVHGVTPTCLIAMWDNPFQPELMQNVMDNLSSPANGFFPDKQLMSKTGLPILNSLNGDHRIILLPRAFDEWDLASIYKLADLAIFPYCAEGWNLPLIETLACGTRCVATNYSGPTEYLPDTDCTLIEDYTLEVADDGYWFRGDVGKWAVVDYEKLYDLVIPLILEGKGISNTCAAEVLTKWNWEQAALKSIEALSAIGIEVETNDRTKRTDTEV